MVVWMNKSELPNTITRWERVLLFSCFSASLQSKGEVVLYPQSRGPTLHLHLCSHWHPHSHVCPHL